LAHAKQVVRELMQGSEAVTRSWRLDVYGDHKEPAFKLLFATFDPSLEHLLPSARMLVEMVCDLRRSSRETVHAARVTGRESRALIAQSRGRPYLAAIRGEQTR
jgi:hypothetical protein